MTDTLTSAWDAMRANFGVSPAAAAPHGWVAPPPRSSSRLPQRKYRWECGRESRFSRLKYITTSTFCIDATIFMQDAVSAFQSFASFITHKANLLFSIESLSSQYETIPESIENVPSISVPRTATSGRHTGGGGESTPDQTPAPPSTRRGGPPSPGRRRQTVSGLRGTTGRGTMRRVIQTAIQTVTVTQTVTLTATVGSRQMVSPTAGTRGTASGTRAELTAADSDCDNQTIRVTPMVTTLD